LKEGYETMNWQLRNTQSLLLVFQQRSVTELRPVASPWLPQPHLLVCLVARPERTDSMVVEKRFHSNWCRKIIVEFATYLNCG
jgi:hypothetical protein